MKTCNYLRCCCSEVGEGSLVSVRNTVRYSQQGIHALALAHTLAPHISLIRPIGIRLCLFVYSRTTIIVYLQRIYENI